MPTELASALVRAVRAGRLESDVVRPALEALETFAIETADLPGLAADAADLALELRLHPADTAFLALALRRSINIVTADRRLHEGASAAGYEVIWLADLPV